MAYMATGYLRLLNSLGNLSGIRKSGCCQIILAIIGLTDVSSRWSSRPSHDLEPGQSSKLVVQGHTQPKWTANRRHDQICPTLRSTQIASLRGNQSCTRKGSLALGIEIVCVPYSREPSSRLKHTPNSSVCS